MDYEFSEAVIREVIASIRMRDERADSTDWRWAEMDPCRQEYVVADLLDCLTVIQRDDLMSDACCERSLSLYRIKTHNPIRSRMVRMLTPWFEQVIEPRVNARIAA